MSYTVQDYCRAINGFAPFATAEDWDNVGLLVGGGEQPVTRAMVALDATHAVVGEAAGSGAQLLGTHHPVIFRPLKRVEAHSVVARLLRENIAVISAHTNWDAAEGGVNDALAARLGLCDVDMLDAAEGERWYKLAVFVPHTHAEQVYAAMCAAGAGRLGSYSHCAFLSRGEGRFLPLEGACPSLGAVGTPESVPETRLEMLVSPGRAAAVTAAMLEAHPYETPAYDLVRNEALRDKTAVGRVGALPSPESPDAFAARVKGALGSTGLRYTAGGDEIRRVAVFGGAGADALYAAAREGCQALVTSEVKHHQWLDAAGLGITLVDAGHFATENTSMEPLAACLRKALPQAEILVAQSCTDGVKIV